MFPRRTAPKAGIAFRYLCFPPSTKHQAHAFQGTGKTERTRSTVDPTRLIGNERHVGFLSVNGTKDARKAETNKRQPRPEEGQASGFRNLSCLVASP